MAPRSRGVPELAGSGTSTHLQFQRRACLVCALSPDGRYLAYSDTKGLHVRSMESSEEHDVALPAELRPGIIEVRWFPDGIKLLLQSQASELWVTSLLGGAPRLLRSHSRPGRISPDGSSIAFADQANAIWVMDSNGEHLQKILDGSSGEIRALEWSPTGRRLVYGVYDPSQVVGMSIATVALDGSKPVQCFHDPLLDDQDSSLVWTADGRLIFGRSDSASQNTLNLWQIQLDPKSGVTSGEPKELTHSDGWMAATGTNDGKHLVAIKAHARQEIFVGELKENGRSLEKSKKVTFNDRGNFPEQWYPDGKALLISSNRTGKYLMYRQSLEEDSAQPLFPGSDAQVGGRMTPDGAWIFYFTMPPAAGSFAGVTQRLMRAPASGGFGQMVLETAPGEVSGDIHCGRMGSKQCLIGRSEKDDLVFYEIDPLKGQGKELGRTTVGAPGGYMSWDLSADGTQIIVAGSVGLEGKVRLVDLKKHAYRDLALPPHVSPWTVCWSADSRALYLAAQRSTSEWFISWMDLSGNSKIVTSQPSPYYTSLALSPDGHFLAYAKQSGESNAFLLENF